MKKLFYLIAFFTLQAHAQDRPFEGLIIYQYQYFDLDGNDITDTKGRPGDMEQHYYINSSNYKSHNESGIFKQLFNSSNNEYYINFDNSIYMIDASVSFSDTVSVEMLEEKAAILGRNCRSVKINSDQQETIYFFSDEIFIDPRPFTSHEFGNWNQFLEASRGALSLQYISYHEDYVTVHTAREIIPMQFEEDDFEIDKVLGLKEQMEF
jgi:hypothetical protein